MQDFPFAMIRQPLTGNVYRVDKGRSTLCQLELAAAVARARMFGDMNADLIDRFTTPVLGADRSLAELGVADDRERLARGEPTAYELYPEAL